MATLWAAPTGTFSETLNWSDPDIWRESSNSSWSAANYSHLTNAGRVPEKGDSVIIGPMYNSNPYVGVQNLNLDTEDYGNFRNLPSYETFRQLRNWRAFQGDTGRTQTKDLKLIGNPDYYVEPGGMFHEPYSSSAGGLVASSSSINSYSDKLFISCWAFSNYHGGTQYIAVKGNLDKAAPNQFALYRSGNYFYIEITQYYDPTDVNAYRTAYVRVTSAIPSQKWAHIAAVWDGSSISSAEEIKTKLKLFINNIEVLSDGSSSFAPYWYFYSKDSNPLTSMGGSVNGFKDPVFTVGALDSRRDAYYSYLHPFYGTIKNLSLHDNVSDYASKINSLYNNQVILDSDSSVWSDTNAEHLYSFEDSSNIGKDSRGSSDLTEYDPDAGYSYINVHSSSVKFRGGIAPLKSNREWQEKQTRGSTYNTRDDGSDNPTAIPSGQFTSPTGFYLAASGVPVMPLYGTVGWRNKYNAETGIIQTSTSKGNGIRFSYSGLSNSYYGISSDYDSDHTKTYSYYLKNVKFESINTGDGFVKDPSRWTDDHDYFHWKFHRVGPTINAATGDFPYDKTLALSNSTNSIGRSINDMHIAPGGRLNMADNTKLHLDGNLLLQKATTFNMVKGELVSTRHRGYNNIMLYPGMGHDWSFSGSETRLNTTISTQASSGNNFINLKADQAEKFGEGDMILIEPEKTFVPSMMLSGVNSSGQANFLGYGKYSDTPKDNLEESFMVSHVDSTLDKLYISEISRSSASVIADSNGSEILISDIEGDLFSEGDSVVINNQVVVVSEIKKAQHIYYEYPFDNASDFSDWSFDTSSDKASATEVDPYSIEWRVRENATGLNYLSMTGFQPYFLNGSATNHSGHSSYNRYYYDQVLEEGSGVVAGTRSMASQYENKTWEWNNSPIAQEYNTLWDGHGDLAGQPNNGFSDGTFYARNLIHKSYYEDNAYIELEMSPLSDFSTGKLLANHNKGFGFAWDLPLGQSKPIDVLPYTMASKVSVYSYPGHYSNIDPHVYTQTLGGSTAVTVDITGYNGKEKSDFYKPKKYIVSKLNGMETVSFDGDVISQIKQKNKAGRFGLWSSNPMATFKNIKLGVNCYKLTLNGFVVNDSPAIAKGDKVVQLGRLKSNHSIGSRVTKLAGSIVDLKNFNSIASPINQINSIKNPENYPANKKLPASTKDFPSVCRWSKHSSYSRQDNGGGVYFAGWLLDPYPQEESLYYGTQNQDHGVLIIDLRTVKNFNHISLSNKYNIGQVQDLRISLSNDGFNFTSIRDGSWMNNHNLFQTHKLSNYETSPSRNTSMYDGDTDKRLMGKIRYYNILPSSTVDPYYSNGGDSVSARFVKIEFKQLRSYSNSWLSYYFRSFGVYDFEFEKKGGTKIAPKFEVKLSSVSDLEVGDRLHVICTNSRPEGTGTYSPANNYNSAAGIWNRSSHWSVGRLASHDFYNNLESDYEIIAVNSGGKTVQLNRPLETDNLMLPDKMGQKIFIYKVNRDFKIKGLIGSGESGEDTYSATKVNVYNGSAVSATSYELNFKNIEFSRASNQYNTTQIYLHNDYLFENSKIAGSFLDTKGRAVRRDFDFVGEKKIGIIIDGNSFTNNAIDNLNNPYSVQRASYLSCPVIIKKNILDRIYMAAACSTTPQCAVGYLRYCGNIKTLIGDFTNANAVIRGNVSVGYDFYGGEFSMYLPFAFLGGRQDLDDLLFLTDNPSIKNLKYSYAIDNEDQLVNKIDGFLEAQGGSLLTAGRYSSAHEPRFGLDLMNPKLLEFEWIAHSWYTRSNKLLLKSVSNQLMFQNQNKKYSYIWNQNLHEKSKFYSDHNSQSIVEIGKNNSIKYHSGTVIPYNNTVTTVERPVLSAIFQGETNGGYKIRFKGSVKMLSRVVLGSPDADKPLIQSHADRNYHSSVNDHMPSVFAYDKSGSRLVFSKKIMNRNNFKTDVFFNFDETIEVKDKEKVFVGFTFNPYRYGTVELYGFSAAVLDAETSVFEHHNDFRAFDKNYVERLDDRLQKHTAVGTASSTLDMGSISGITIKLQ